MTRMKKNMQGAPLDEKSAQPPSDGSAEFVVAVGSSAGGLEALLEFLSQVPKETSLSFVLIQHTSPDFETMLPNIIERNTGHQVELAQEGEIVAPGKFYLMPPNKLMSIFYKKILLEEREETQASSFYPIDKFFESLAQDYRSRAIGVVLSGTGRDGTKGATAIKDVKGCVLVQEPSTAIFPTMPRNVIVADSYDSALKPADLYQAIELYTEGDFTPDRRADMQNCSSTNYDRVLQALRSETGVDFNCYRNLVHEKRMTRRADIVGTSNISDYCDYVLQDSKELRRLFDDLILSVSEFDQYRESLDQLKSQVLQKLIKERSRDTQLERLRFWVIGCSTGEEAYTLGFLVSDLISELGINLDFKIFATDIDDRALRIASRGVYSVADIAQVRPLWQKKYLLIKDQQFHIKPSLRSHIVFAKHNVIEDAPFPGIDLIVCRDLLKILNDQTQQKILTYFQFSLKNNGFLLLSPEEDINFSDDSFENVQNAIGSYRCARARASFSKLSRMLAEQQNHSAIEYELSRQESEKKKSLADFELKLYEKIVSQHIGGALLIVDQHLNADYFFGDVKQYLNNVGGKASHNLQDLMPDSLLRVIRHLFSQLNTSQTHLSELLKLDENNQGIFLIELIDLQLTFHSHSYFLIKIREKSETIIYGDDENDAISQNPVASENKRLKEELLAARRELSDMRTEMDSVIGQLEASNEELRTTNEEMQASAEEIQSTNEELQAVNEELYSVNAECQLRISELSELSSDIDSVYEIAEVGTIFLDETLRIKKYNMHSQQVFKLLPDDIGRPLAHFSSNLTVDFVSEIEKTILDDKLRQFVAANSDVDYKYLVRIAPYSSVEANVNSKGAILVFLDIGSLAVEPVSGYDLDDPTFPQLGH